MNIEQAKAIALPEILRKIGVSPVKQKTCDIWYNSPFRQERTASLHVNTNKNVWYDFGEAKGGGVIEFICAYLQSHNEDHTVVDALRWLGNMMAMPISDFFLKSSEPFRASSRLVLQKLYELKHKGLISYLNSRGIPLDLANKYLKEALIKNKETNRTFYTIAFENEGKGFELRNKIFKGSLAPKGISFIRGTKLPADEVHVFEGFMDFLSAASRQKNYQFAGDAIILNSVACLPQAIPYLKNYCYRKLYAWLDNDVSGIKTTQILKKITEQEAGCSFQTMNKTYAPHKDVNAWHVQKLVK